MSASIAAKGTEGKTKEAMLAERILRGLEHYSVRHDEIEWVAEDRCYVPSRSVPGRRYLVIFGESGERCRCEDFRRHGQTLGLCLHTVSAMVASVKRPTYRVIKRYDSRAVADLYVLVELRAGVERELLVSSYPGAVYEEKFAVENPEWEVA